jgi:hypothetical protein
MKFALLLRETIGCKVHIVLLKERLLKLMGSTAKLKSNDY